MTHHLPPPDELGPEPAEHHLYRAAPRGHADDRAATRHWSLDHVLKLAAGGQVSSTPFAWQHGPCFYLLVRERPGWVLAEMRFVPIACHYVEIRRTSYRWPREAAGVLLSRSLSAGEAASRKLATDVASWLTALNEHAPARRTES